MDRRCNSDAHLLWAPQHHHVGSINARGREVEGVELCSIQQWENRIINGQQTGRNTTSYGSITGEVHGMGPNDPLRRGC